MERKKGVASLGTHPPRKIPWPIQMMTEACSSGRQQEGRGLPGEDGKQKAKEGSEPGAAAQDSHLTWKCRCSNAPGGTRDKPGAVQLSRSGDVPVTQSLPAKGSTTLKQSPPLARFHGSGIMLAFSVGQK